MHVTERSDTSANAPVQLRRYSFGLYPSSEQSAELHQQRMMMADLWNALLQRREDVWRRTRAQRGVRHSRKPDEAYEMIERMYPELPKIELFARQARAGWAAWGNEAGEFPQEYQKRKGAAV
jgi:hypothetical protein